MTTAAPAPLLDEDAHLIGGDRLPAMSGETIQQARVLEYTQVKTVSLRG